MTEEIEVYEKTHLNRVQIRLLVEEHLNYIVSSFRIVEVHKQSPMHQPSSLVNQFPFGVERIGIDVCTKLY